MGESYKRAVNSVVGLIAATAMVGLLAIVGPQTAEADESEHDLSGLSSRGIGPSRGGSMRPAVQPGLSTDEDTIAAAAKRYDAANLLTAVRLVYAASKGKAVPLQPVDSGDIQASTDTDSGTVNLSPSGTLTARNSSGISVSINPGGPGNSSKVVEGSLVDEGVAPSTNIVSSATDAGIQTSAVLADSKAPTDVVFPYQLPEGAQLEKQPDGSILVKAPVTNYVAPQSEIDRVNEAVKSIVGESTDFSELTDQQIDQLANIPAENTTPVTTVENVATIAAPWAVDAQGNSLASHYEVRGSEIVQVIKTDSKTAFPVTADPAWWWWVATAAKCVADIASIIFAGAALARLAARISKAAKLNRNLQNLVNALGGAKNMWKKVYYAAKGKIEGNIYKYISKRDFQLLKGVILSQGVSLIFEIAGIGSCYTLIKEIRG